MTKPILVTLSLLISLVSTGFIAADTLPPINDGPYVVWITPVQAMVLYVCDDSLVTRAYTNVDTLHIRAGCDDSAPMLAVPAAMSVIEPDSFINVTKIFAVSDIHGEYEALVQVLKAAGVIDSALSWSWGNGHLVVCGDVCDRGDKVTEAYWLIYRLEQEAARAGGGAHLLLGNHERKDIRGEDNDVNEVYTDGIVKKARLAHEDLFGPDTELGQWLRTRNTIIKINDLIFLHGGLSPELCARGWSRSDINRKVRQNLDLRSTQTEFSAEPKFLFGELGPMWYRGLFMSREGKYNQLTESEVSRVVKPFGASAMVVGHTENEHAGAYYGGLVWGLDMPVKGADSMEGLLWQDGHCYRVSGNGTREQLQ